MSGGNGWFDHPRNVRLLFIGFVVLCVVVVGIDFWRLAQGKDKFTGGNLYGYYGFYAGIGVTLLVFASVLLRKIVKRPEDYYDE